MATAKMFQIVFSFLDPSRAVGTILAETPEEAIEKLKQDIAENSPGVEDLEIIEVLELTDTGHQVEDLSEDRSLN